MQCFICTSAKIYACFEQKTAFVMQNVEFGPIGRRVKFFLTKPKKAHPWLISHVLSRLVRLSWWFTDSVNRPQ